MQLPVRRACSIVFGLSGSMQRIICCGLNRDQCRLLIWRPALHRLRCWCQLLPSNAVASCQERLRLLSQANAPL